MLKPDRDECLDVVTGFWTNNKNGKDYLVTGLCKNATNANDGDIMVLYTRDGSPYIREYNEFIAKFTFNGDSYKEMALGILDIISNSRIRINMVDSLGKEVYSDSIIEYETINGEESGTAKITYDGGSFSVETDDGYIPPLCDLSWFKVV